MAKQFLDYEGLDYYDSLIKQFINNGLNDTLQSALEHFSGALIPRGVIKNIKGATYIDMRSEALDYYKAKTGDVYFIGEDDLKLTYVDTTGAVVQDEEVDKGDAIVCIVSADIATNGIVVSAAQWATLQSNWSVTPNNSARLEFGKSQTTIKLAEVGGETIQLQVAPSSTIASSLRDDLADLGVVAVQKGTARPAKNIATSITSSSAGNLVPTDKAVYDFVSQNTFNAVTDVRFAEEEDGSLVEPPILSVTKGGEESWSAVPIADETHSGFITKEAYQELKESVNTVTPLIDDEGSLTIENAFNNGDTFSFPVPLASEYNDGAMSKEDKAKVETIKDKSVATSERFIIGEGVKYAKVLTCVFTPYEECSGVIEVLGRQTCAQLFFALGSGVDNSFNIGNATFVVSGSDTAPFNAKIFSKTTTVKQGEEDLPAREFSLWCFCNSWDYTMFNIKSLSYNLRDGKYNSERIDTSVSIHEEYPDESLYDNVKDAAVNTWRGKSYSADVAYKLGTTTVGSTTKPIYLNNGTATPINYSIEKSVPANAVFTDTHHTAKNVVSNTASTTANSAANGTVHLNLVENGTCRSAVRVSGTGGTKVTANGSGVVTIESPSYGIATETTNGLITSSMAKKLAELDSTYPRLKGGTAITTTGEDLNDLKFFEIGTYYCATSSIVETFSNCPTDLAFIMWVDSGTGDPANLNDAYVYRTRRLKTFRGDEFMQRFSSDKGSVVIGEWIRITTEEDIKGLVKDVNVRHDASGNVLVETEDYEGDFSSVTIPFATEIASGVMSADMYKRLDFGTRAQTYVLPHLQDASNANRNKPIIIKLGTSSQNISYTIDVTINGYDNKKSGNLLVSLYNFFDGGYFAHSHATSTFGATEGVKCFNRNDGYTYCIMPSFGYFNGYDVTVSANQSLAQKPSIYYGELPAETEIVQITDIPVTNIAYEPEERSKVSGLISGSVSAGNASLLEGIGASGFTRTISGTMDNLGENTVRYVKIARITKDSQSTSNIAAVKINGLLGDEKYTSVFDLALSSRGSKNFGGYCKKSILWDYGDIGINDASEICLIFKRSWCRYALSVSVVQSAVIEYDDDFTPTDTNFALLSESNNVIFSNRNTNAVTAAEKATNDGNGANIATTYLTKAQVNTAASSSLGVKVAFSGTMGNLLPNVTVTSGSVANSANNVVTGHAVHTALTGDTYISRIANDDIDNLFA